MNIQVTNHGNSYRLGAAVLLYEQKHIDPYNPSAPTAFATVHTISDSANRPVMEPGRPMTEQDFQAMIDVLSPKERPQMVWQEPGILARGLGRMIWWTPAGKRPMFFKPSNLYSGTFEGQAVCPLPALLWHATRNDLYVYAFKGEAAPTRETTLCQAPLFNIWAAGKVCRGNATLPQDDQKGDPKAWESMVFSSNFTHPNFTEKDRLISGQDPVRFWRDMIAKPEDTFPQHRLVELPLKVNDLMGNDLAEKLASLEAEGEF